jgi:outer membrane protein assembly factor BamB
MFARKKAGYLDAEVQSKTKYQSQSSANDAANGFASEAPASANTTVAWENIGQANVSSLQAFQGSRIYYRDGKSYNTMGDEIVCTDSTSGKTLWKKKLNGDIHEEGGAVGTSPASAGGDLFVATLGGEVLQLGAKSGNVKKTYNVGSPVRAQPAIVDGRIYVGTQDGKVVCIDTGDRKLTGWNTWGKDSRRSGTER